MRRIAAIMDELRAEDAPAAVRVMFWVYQRYLGQVLTTGPMPSIGEAARATLENGRRGGEQGT